MFGKSHSVESREKMSKIRKTEEWYNTIQIKTTQALKNAHQKYVVIDECLLCKKEFEYLTYDKRKFCSQQCSGRWNLLNGVFQKNEPNSWEQRIIDLNIENVKYVGNHSFWITLFDKTKNKFVYKNPDFIIQPFSQTKKVVEVWGDWWHRNENIDELKEMYNVRGIKVLFLRTGDMKNSDEYLSDTIRRFLANNDNQQNKIYKKNPHKRCSLRHYNKVRYINMQ